MSIRPKGEYTVIVHPAKSGAKKISYEDAMDRFNLIFENDPDLYFMVPEDIINLVEWWLQEMKSAIGYEEPVQMVYSSSYAPIT